MNDVRTSMKLFKKQNIIALLFCVGGIMLNLLLGMTVSLLGLPLYMDTVGTVVVAAAGGYLPGVIVGFVTNIIKCIYDPASLHYGVLNVMIAFCTSWFARRKLIGKPFGIIAMVLTFTLIGGGLGSVIPWFVDGLTFDSESLAGAIYSTGYFGHEISYLLAGLITDLPDKVVSVALALVILYLIPKRFYPDFAFTSWKQAPLSAEEIASASKTKMRRMSLQKKILFIFGASLIIVSLTAIIIGVSLYRSDIIKDRTQLAQGTAKLATRVIDGDRIDEFLKNGENSPEYLETQSVLEDILSSSPEISYLYVYKMEENGLRVVFDIDTEDTIGEKANTLIPYDNTFIPYKSTLLAGEAVEPIITNDEYGHLLTAAERVFDTEGICQCYAVADVDMDRLAEIGRSFFMEMLSLFLGFFILICVFVSWLIKYHIIFPINSIAECMDESSYTGDDQEKMDEYVRKLRSLDIITGDEVEKLYNSICKTTRDQAEQLRSIRRLSDSTAVMQDGLIITMADLVESRDSDTGAHIQKTAAYVRIIVEGLRKKGYYAEKITSKFVSDVVRSAPLHDVGKINIPDNVLNQPRKLTDEEYEIMKTHTTIGKEIIEKAINTVHGGSYLKEARNMAAYHHERWDGKGYPTGLHGEVIPLSARIMAVADVFDALTSPRVYKPAFPIEKALDIIKEGAGTQFDPKCVEVFLDSLPEVKVILKKFNSDAV